MIAEAEVESAERRAQRDLRYAGYRLRELAEIMDYMADIYDRDACLSVLVEQAAVRYPKAWEVVPTQDHVNLLDINMRDIEESIAAAARLRLCFEKQPEQEGGE